MSVRTVRDDRLNHLGNAISDALNAALRSGLEPDAACSVAVTVAGDYWRHYFGPSGLEDLAALMAHAGPHDTPAPPSQGDG